MKILLDTHALLWAVQSRAQLSRKAAIIVADSDNEIFVSAASAWEVATKVRSGKLDIAIAFEINFLAAIAEAGYTLLSITTEHALRAGRMVGEHRDPFDRMIAAQALADDMPILSNDTKLDLFGIRRIW